MATKQELELKIRELQEKNKLLEVAKPFAVRIFNSTIKTPGAGEVTTELRSETSSSSLTCLSI